MNVITAGIDGGPNAAEEAVRELAQQDARIHPGDACKPGRRARRSTGSTSSKASTLPVSCTWPCCLDRATSRNIVMASTEGGVEIEKVAEETPEKILKAEIDPAVGLAAFQANELSHGLGTGGRQPPRASVVLSGLSPPLPPNWTPTWLRSTPW